MTTIALKGPGFEPMSAEGDSTAWTAIVGAGSAILGLITGIFFKTRDNAESRGRTDGVLEAKIEALTLRITALEIRKDRIDARLDESATKQDLKDAVNDIKTRLGEIATEVRESRPYRPAPLP